MVKYIYTKIKDVYKWLRSNYHYIKYQYALRREWKTRINDVVNCKDNEYIPRVENAGDVIGDFQIMHNGIKVKKDGYYGSPITRMLKKSKGVHEPQEERVFGEILSQMRNNATIMELGAYWSFYSMWFLTSVKDAKAYLFEPISENLVTGKLNFDTNGLSGNFTACFINDKVDLTTDPPTFNIDHIMTQNKLDFVDILHADIEGYELNMLNGAVKTIEKNGIDYFLISTHSNDLHYACLDFLKVRNFIIICESDKSNTYSYDGLIVARLANYPGIAPLKIAQKLSIY